MFISLCRSPTAGVMLSSRSICSALKVMWSAAVFSSTRATRFVPGIGAMSFPCASSHANTGWLCLSLYRRFPKAQRTHGELLQSPLFKIGGTPILTLNKEQKKSVAAIFQKMNAEQDSRYAYKDQLIRNYLQLIIHEALK